MDITLNQLSLAAENILLQLRMLTVEFFDSLEVAFFLFFARLFLGLENLFMP